MVNEELDVSLLLLFHDALESVWSGCASYVATAEKLACSEYAIADFDLRNADGLIAEFGIEASIEVALHHGFLVSKAGLHGIDTAHLVAYRCTVAFDFLTLEGRALSDRFSTLVLEDGSYCDDCLLLHVFDGECAVDSGRNFAANEFERCGNNGKVFVCELAELAARAQNEGRCGCHENKEFCTFHCVIFVYILFFGRKGTINKWNSARASQKTFNFFAKTYGFRREPTHLEAFLPRL